ncbi:unnamed protein product [Schistosoma mattheei]|uniref:Transmembrane protein 242 n=1 Tax=Schistosoma mattheei TaxID=31246 RepID=A0AA85B4E8_9TREM|nr:unnamed protein product [Schistosoma mattheei]
MSKLSSLLSKVHQFFNLILMLCHFSQLYCSQAINQDKTMHESGIHFAARALGVATIITTSSLGALFLCTWYIINPVDRNDFNERIRNVFPYRWKIKSSDNRSEIRTFEELSSLINDSVKNK